MVQLVDLPHAGAHALTAAEFLALLTAQDPRTGVSRAKIGATGWLNTFIGTGYEDTNQLVSMSTHGCAGAVFATRSSDQAQAGAQSGYAFGSFALNDNVAFRQTTYGGYIEAIRYPGAGNTIGLEVDVTATGAPVTQSPYLFIPDGISPGLWLQAFQSRIPGVPATNPSCAIGILSIGCKWGSGIVFSTGSVAGNVDNFAPPIAMDMPEQYAIVWRNHIDAQPVANIRSDCKQPVTASHGGGAIVFNDGGVDHQSQDGRAQLHLSNAGVVFANTAFVGQAQMFGLGQHADNAAAIAAGLPDNTLYVTADGSVKMRLPT